MKLKVMGRMGPGCASRQRSFAMALLAAWLGWGNPVLAQPAATTGGTGTPEGAGAERVACLLPADIDRFGRQLTIAGARQKIETSRADCDARGGEVIEERGPPTAPEESTR